jgi:hypothetical protein
MKKSSLVACAALAMWGCTKTENVSWAPPVTITIKGVEGLPQGPIVIEGLPEGQLPFDGLRVDIVGGNWEVTGTVRAEFEDNNALLVLPARLDPERLCKVARDNADDYTGYWPASQVDDRNARVAGFKGHEIIAVNGNTVVGRLYLSNWNGDPSTRGELYNIRFHYSDRPFTLGGTNIRPPGTQASFRYEASFGTGWSVYANVTSQGWANLCTTAIPAGTTMRWRFEKNP